MVLPQNMTLKDMQDATIKNIICLCSARIILSWFVPNAVSTNAAGRLSGLSKKNGSIGVTKKDSILCLGFDVPDHL